MIAKPAPDGGISAQAPFLRLPSAGELFGRRAARLRELAKTHPAGDWLEALGQICQAQERAATEVPGSLEGSDLEGSHPLHFARWRRDPAWRAGLALVLDQMREAPLPEAAREAVARLGAAKPEEIEAWADALLSGSAGPGPAAAPFLAAGLQTYFATLAERIPAESVARSAHICPVCASPPVAGLVTGDGEARYLVCSLCAAQWHLVRVQCAICGSAAGLFYPGVDGDGGGVKAEACAACRTYLKLLYREKLPGAEALADDAATRDLDFLMTDHGYERSGANPFAAVLAGD